MDDVAGSGPARLLTVGHGTLAASDLIALLQGAGVGRLVDVRAYPGSRRHPQFGREEMARWVPEAGLDHRWLRDLGGRRRPVPASRHTAIRNESFRAYADHMETTTFRSAVDELIALASEQPTAIMCSESLWWRCHRRLIADHLVLARGIVVEHLAHDGRRTPHPPTEGVRPDGDGVAYDLQSGTPPFPLT